MKILIQIARVIVGVLFIFSGLIKANDPLGLSYKMQEFFEVWNFHWLDNYTLAFSLIMIVFEIIAGVAILVGWRMKLFAWLLLILIIFFSFLTGYAYLSGKVRECGCFGNCIPLTAGQSFTKDLVLLALILFLFFQVKRIRPLLSLAGSLAVLLLSTVLAIAFQWYVLVHLPLVDCLPYRVGANIPEKMKPPPGAVPDSTVITFVYEHHGQQIEFTADKFPADFDSTYKLVNRYDKLIRKGNAEPSIKDFALTTAGGQDSTQEILEQKGYKLFFFTKGIADESPSWNKEFIVILTMARSKRIPIYFITSDYDGIRAWMDRIGFGPEIMLLKCDGVAVKTAARANPTLFLLKRGTILNKWSYADFGLALPDINALPDNTGLAVDDPSQSPDTGKASDK
jgi:uncharacterized membrane protein YphA (DoxX/SURF4 family)